MARKRDIYDLLGVALGVMGMSLGDFCLLPPEGFQNSWEAYSEQRNEDYRAAWERTRMLAAIAVQPYSKRRTTPQELLPFPWEKAERKKAASKPVTKEEGLKRFKELTGKEGQ